MNVKGPSHNVTVNKLILEQQSKSLLTVVNFLTQKNILDRNEIQAIRSLMDIYEISVTLAQGNCESLLASNSSNVIQDER